MANKEHFNLLKQGTIVWNQWRVKNYNICPDLSEEDLNGMQLSGVNLSEANLRDTDFRSANLRGAYLGLADFRGANLRLANLRLANLSEANLSEANLRGADLSESNLRLANLSKARLRNAKLIETNFEKATLTGCEIYGISAWGLRLEQTDQSNLTITSGLEPVITVDNLEVAQFIYLLLQSKNIRDVIDTITSKVVLILGRFGERKAFFGCDP